MEMLHSNKYFRVPTVQRMIVGIAGGLSIGYSVGNMLGMIIGGLIGLVAAFASHSE